MIIILPFVSLPAKAQKVKYSKDSIVVEKVPVDKIREYRNDNDFKYIKKKQAQDSLWDIFWFYFFKFLKYIFSDKGIIPYVRNSIIALFIIFIAIRLFRADFSNIFAKNRNIKYSGFEYKNEDIRGINFEQEINNALENKDYQLAIRFLYLKFLDTLNRKELIDWTPEKTNRKYLQELKDSEIYTPFKNLSRIYEYSWYGNFKPDKIQFNTFLKEFNSIFSIINNK